MAGQVAPGYEDVAAAFAANRDELGAGCCVIVDGEVVLDVWGGDSDPAGTPWRADSIAVVMSASKGVVAVLCAVLHDRGVLDLDEPVRAAWPEFAVEGKQDVSLRMVLSHTAGMPVLEGTHPGTTLLDPERVAELLATQRPLWTPGTAYLYHPLTYGWLVGEVVRRATGCSLGTTLRELIAGPLCLDLHLGINPAELARVAELQRQAPTAQTPPAPDDVRWRAGHAHPEIAPTASNYNHPENLTAEIAGVNVVTNARALARLYAACLGPADGRLVEPQTLRDCTREVTAGLNPFIGEPARFGAGFQLPTASSPMLSPSSFGHVGGGGALGFADPEHAVAFGYVPNRLLDAPGPDPRSQRIIAALRPALRGGTSQAEG